MPTDYEAIRTDNKQQYGTAIGRIGPILLANRYDDRNHFIFELLQNAEDALAKCERWEAKREVEFSLSPDALSVTHFGKPFDEDDVRGVCGIGESTKGLTSIGRFGIGFKSVYAFTDSPEIHSGSEHFAIDSFVWPRAIAGDGLPPEQTVIRLPFRSNDPTAATQILAGLKRLGPRTLLFLREIEEISWSDGEGTSGMYLRSRPKTLSKNARQVLVIGRTQENIDVEEEWLIFSRPVSNKGDEVGHIEIAFALEEDAAGQGWSVQRITDSPLVVFFPTVLSTNLGFLVQGPYRTTPSRDNVPEGDPWNQQLVKETAILLVEALRELRALSLLDASALRTLPLDASRFTEGSRFAPLFSRVREALMKEPLLPRYKNGHVPAQGARIARTQDLRDLIGAKQLADLFQSDHEPAWLSADITVDRTPDLRSYLIEALDVDEITPEWLVPRLTKAFLEAQPDEWIEQLYIFLNGQSALLPRLRQMPLIRLEDGSHITFNKNQPQAFLPVGDRTDFPTVQKTVCKSEDALAFLKSLGLSAPDPVDDVIANVLPKYEQDHPDVSERDYRSDIERILVAFATDSTARRQRLASALGKVSFVWAVDTANGSHYLVRPSNAYQATQRLKSLFEGVPGVLLVDDSKDYLRGDRVRTLLETAGCPLYLIPVPTDSTLTWEEKADLRRKSWHSESTYEIAVHDSTLMGLIPLLKRLEGLDGDEASDRSDLLWEALCDVQDRRGEGAFKGEYSWMRYGERRAEFDASFVKMLNETNWVPDENGVLRRPGDVVFERTKWKTNPSLLEKIRFKPPVIDELAREAGIDPRVLTLLAQHNLSVEEFTELLRRGGLIDDSGGKETIPSVEDALHGLLGKSPEPTSPITEPPEPTKHQGLGGVSGASAQTTVPVNRPGGNHANHPAGATQGEHARSENAPSQLGTGRGTHSGGGRKFKSYVALSPDKEEADPDGLTHQERIDLEDRAIELILESEPGLKRTPTNNPGFDLTELGSDGEPVKWVEVKAMRGTLEDRPVGLSRTQFECAQTHGRAFWLYVVENAGAPEQARILRIPDPAGNAGTFTFDRGWTAVAEGPKTTVPRDRS